MAADFCSNQSGAHLIKLGLSLPLIRCVSACLEQQPAATQALRGKDLKPPPLYNLSLYSPIINTPFLVDFHKLVRCPATVQYLWIHNLLAQL